MQNVTSGYPKVFGICLKAGVIVILLLTAYLYANGHIMYVHVPSGAQQDMQYKTSVDSVPAEEPMEEPIVLIPNSTVLSRLSKDQLFTNYWRYINTLQVLCRNQMRIGTLDDGGKEVCIDRHYRPSSPCLVYSFGINWQFDFDLAVKREFGCEIHCFDPSMNTDNRKTPSEVEFHKEGLSNKAETRANGWKVNTLKYFMKSLSHENKTVDILKMDIEGDEWIAVPNMIADGVLDRVKQMQIEFHFDDKHISHTNLGVLRQIYESGFRLFMHDRNTHPAAGKKNRPGLGMVTPLNELAFLNMKYFR